MEGIEMLESTYCPKYIGSLNMFIVSKLSYRGHCFVRISDDSDIYNIFSTFGIKKIRYTLI